ncbi:MAG: hypothetical protein KDB21_06770 [Acidimicrobiales bacterium]|nr:hypothetical protein [Acidimicrobiales bacterium]
MGADSATPRPADDSERFSVWDGSGLGMLGGVPEGDTIHRARLRLEPILTGQVVEEFWARKLRGPKPRAGQRVEGVRAHGKHLLVDFDRDLTLDVHLGMAGVWRDRPPGTDVEALRRNPRLRVLISTAKGHAICYSAPTIQSFVRTQDVTPVSALGPDLTQPAPDLDAVLHRARSLCEPEAALTEVLLDQYVAAGVGNVFKSEALHVCGLWPFTPLAALDDAAVTELFRVAARQLQVNARDGHQQRATTPHGGLFVYGRWRQPCRRCATPIVRSYRGPSGRSTYWCPRCQPEPVTSG